MGIYIAIMAFIALFGAVLSHGENGNKKAYLIACFALLTVVASIRASTVGADTAMYARSYVAIGSSSWTSLTSSFRYEWGFLVLCKLLGYVTRDPQLLIAVSSLLINIPIAIFIYRNSPKPELSVFLYVGLTYYTQNMNVMREAIAVAFILIAFEMLKSEHRFWFVAFVLIAFSFHKTALFLLVLLPLWNLDFKRKTLIAYLALGVVLFIFATPISNLLAGLLGKDSIYRDEFTGSNYFGALFKALLAMFISFVVLNYYRVGSKRGFVLSQTDRFYCHMLMLWVMFTILGMQIQIYARLCMYFNVFALVGIAGALRFVGDKGERAFLELLIGGVALCYFLIIGIYRPEWQGVIPYEVGSTISALLEANYI